MSSSPTGSSLGFRAIVSHWTPLTNILILGQTELDLGTTTRAQTHHRQSQNQKTETKLCASISNRTVKPVKRTSATSKPHDQHHKTCSKHTRNEPQKESRSDQTGRARMKWETRTPSERENERENEESPNRTGGESRKKRESQNGGTADQTGGGSRSAGIRRKRGKPRLLDPEGENIYNSLFLNFCWIHVSFFRLIICLDERSLKS